MNWINRRINGCETSINDLRRFESIFKLNNINLQYIHTISHVNLKLTKFNIKKYFFNIL